MKNDREFLVGSLQLARDGFVAGVGRVEAMHRAIAAKPFAALAATPVAPVAAGVRALHDGIGGGIYAAVRRIGEGVIAAGIGAAGVAPETWSRRPGWQRLREDVVSAVNGAFGDRLRQRANPLAIGLDFRAGGQPLATTPDALAAAYPEATGRIVVFIHGLCCSEDSWTYRRDHRDPPEGTPYAGRLAAELGCTPVFVRYNTGLPVAENAQALATAIDALVGAWPCRPERIDLVGHSMGGLVARGALRHGHASSHAWAGMTRRLVCLGTPHLGAPLEKVTHLAAGILDMFEVTRPLSRIADGRSAGIRDLRHGRVDDGGSADAADPAAAPLPPTCRVGFVAATVGAEADSPASRILGDGLVRVGSALATGLGADDIAVVGGIHHLDLLNHPRVYPLLSLWLGEPTGA